MGRPAIWTAALAVLAALLLYSHTLGYGFYWDDVDVLRPWSFHDVAATFVGPYRPWDPAIAFYRPLTAAYYAAISAVWGFHATPLHVIPIVGIAVLGVVTSRFVLRESGSAIMAGLAAVLVSAHPTLASSMGPWIANQYHTFMTICLVAALCVWQQDRLRARAWWWRAAPWLIAAAWFKEDGLLLPVAIVCVQWARFVITRDLPAPSRAAWLALAALAVSLIAWRSLWLTSQLGYGLRSPGHMLANVLRAPRYVLLWQVGPAVTALPAMVAKAAVFVASAWVLLRARTSPGARVIVIGLVVMCIANLPLVFVSSEGRWHLVGWGAVLMTSGALGEWIARAPRWGWPATAAILVALSASAIERIATFAPCSTDSLVHNQEMAEMTGLPPELHNWLTQHEAACRAGRAETSMSMRDLKWGR